MTVLNDASRRLFEPFAFGTLSTINPDGGPQVTLTAAFLNGDEIVLFHPGGYRKLHNIRRNPLVDNGGWTQIIGVGPWMS